MNYTKRPTWELKNIAKALSMLSLLNTPEEDERLKMVKLELKRRARNES